MWTRPWTVIQDFARQPDQPNRIYYEPRCHEGNYGLPGLLIGARAEEQAYEEGRGPHPATRCIASCSSPEGARPVGAALKDSRPIFGGAGWPATKRLSLLTSAGRTRCDLRLEPDLQSTACGCMAFRRRFPGRISAERLATGVADGRPRRLRASIATMLAC